jgi:hypothetical protein
VPPEYPPPTLLDYGKQAVNPLAGLPEFAAARRRCRIASGAPMTFARIAGIFGH